MKVYRVCTLTQVDEDIERDLTVIPGWRCSLTGFWTTSRNAAENILEDRNTTMFNWVGGFSWSRIVMTDIKNVEVVKNHYKYKEKNINKDKAELYDTNELFIKRIKDLSKVWAVKKDKPITEIENDFKKRRKNDKKKKTKG